MSKVTTNKGRVLNMGALAQQNENMVAMGNAGLNARGDRVDRDGNVITAVEVVMAEYNDTNLNAVRKVGLNDLVADSFTPNSEPEPEHKPKQFKNTKTLTNPLLDRAASIKSTGKVRPARKLNPDAE